MPTNVVRLWPEPDSSPLDDAALVAAYTTPDRPFLRTNFIASADGAATVDDRSGALGGPADKRVFGLLRVPCDAVMVGAGTLRAERYGPMVVDEHHQELRRSVGKAPQPVLVAVSGALDLDPEHAIFTDAPVRPWVLTHEGSPADRREALASVAEVLVCGASVVDLREGLSRLAGAGVQHVLSEGGPHLLGAQVAADLLDELCLTVAPRLAGAGAGRIIAGPLAALQDLELGHVLKSDAGELFLRYRRTSP
jgi:riboflavin biosynthesis pyrimidine reductase